MHRAPRYSVGTPPGFPIKLREPIVSAPLGGGACQAGPLQLFDALERLSLKRPVERFARAQHVVDDPR